MLKSLFHKKIGKRAIAYYRHSAEDKQENSVAIQRMHTQKFAFDHQIEIIHEEADEGKTGLLADRPGFNNLFTQWINNDEAPPFQYVLVYDVSRWGRFQDQDEAAYYTFLCKQRGKQVIYVSHGQLQEEQALMGHLQTSIERYMAAEYSRQLSHKVFYGCIEVSKQGYSAGGTACYGMARLLLDINKNPIRILKHGEHKQISNERVTFVPLGDETTQIVKRIFMMFVEERKSLLQIAQILNQEDIPSALSGKWNRSKIRRILSNPTYMGTRVYNKTWNRLRQGKRSNPQSDWIIREDSFSSVISKETFLRAQERLKNTASQYKKDSFYLFRKVELLARSSIQQYLLENRFHPDTVSVLTSYFPIIVGFPIRFNNLERKWCFFLPEELYMFQFVLAFGISLNTPELIQEIFSLPVNTFQPPGTFVFHVKNGIKNPYKLDEETFKNFILRLSMEICEKFDLPK